MPDLFWLSGLQITRFGIFPKSHGELRVDDQHIKMWQEH